MITRRGLLHGAAVLGAAVASAGCGPSTPERAAGVPRPMRISYGTDPSQFGELHLPADARRAPVVVVIHGGFWRQQYGYDLGTPLAADLANRGIAAWNLEYRRVGGGGGYPQTFADLATGIDRLAALAGEQPIDAERVVLLGHSAGGHLAVWAAGRHTLPAEAVGAAPRLRPRGAVSQAGVLDLAEALRTGTGGSAVSDLVGGTPQELPQRYAQTSPIELVPIGVPVTCVHGAADDIVPLEQSQRYQRSARAAGDTVQVISGAFGHFELIDPSSDPWSRCRTAALDLLDAS